MSDPFLAEIIMFGGNFAPRGWALCDGQILPINSNQALFSLLGTTYGGDGRTSFALPDLRGRTPIHAGNGPGLTDRPLGQKSGVQDVVLTVAEMPGHKHNVALHGESQTANSKNPNGRMLGGPSVDIYADVNASTDLPMASQSITQNNVGGNQQHNNMQPWLAINFIIALQGTFPSRN